MPDPFEVQKLYKYLRVADVCDVMDGMGRHDLGLMDPEVRPLWQGMRFWGPAMTVRCVPANRHMPVLETTEDMLKSHSMWWQTVGRVPWQANVKPGHVIVMDTGGARETGFFGSANSMAFVNKGVVGIVTDGQCRDTGELILQKTPIAARGRARTIIPGRIEVADTQVKIGCGGVQVNPGDMVGCDDDGIIVVPLEIAKEVAVHARAILLNDMRARRKLYEQLKKQPDETVDFEAVDAYYRQFE